MPSSRPTKSKLSSSSCSRRAPPAPTKRKEKINWLTYAHVPGCTCGRIYITIRRQYGFLDRCATCVAAGCPVTQKELNFYLALGLPDYYDHNEFEEARKREIEKLSTDWEKSNGIWFEVFVPASKNQGKQNRR